MTGEGRARRRHRGRPAGRREEPHRPRSEEPEFVGQVGVLRLSRDSVDRGHLPATQAPTGGDHRGAGGGTRRDPSPSGGCGGAVPTQPVVAGPVAAWPSADGVDGAVLLEAGPRVGGTGEVAAVAAFQWLLRTMPFPAPHRPGRSVGRFCCERPQAPGRLPGSGGDERPATAIRPAPVPDGRAEPATNGSGRRSGRDRHRPCPPQACRHQREWSWYW